MIILSATTPPEPELQANIRRFQAGVHLLAALTAQMAGEMVEGVDDDLSYAPIVTQNASIGEKSTCSYPER